MSAEPSSGEPAGGAARPGEREIDLREVAKLINALERDLAKVSSGSKDIKALRDEVEELRRVLHSPAPPESGVTEKLHRLRSRFEKASSPVLLEAIREGQYVAIIGRILGLS
jgi:hypothetical protein